MLYNNRIRGSELYRQQKTTSRTIELKSNFSLNQTGPQWPRQFRARFGSYSSPTVVVVVGFPDNRFFGIRGLSA